MDFQKLAAKRYSVRDFRQTPIPKAAIEQILMAGNAAPTAHNNQPQEIIVVHSPEGLETLKNVPSAIIMHRWHLLFAMIRINVGSAVMIISPVARLMQVLLQRT